MCECGCTSNDERFTFPGPDGTSYMITLSNACVECDAPSGISIERLSDQQLQQYKEMEMIDGPLKFKKWPDSHGVAIVTGMLRHEFSASLQKHLVGVDSHEMGEDGKIDESGAEVILDEMYEDAQCRPRLSRPQR